MQVQNNGYLLKIGVNNSNDIASQLQMIEQYLK